MRKLIYRLNYGEKYTIAGDFRTKFTEKNWVTEYALSHEEEKVLQQLMYMPRLLKVLAGSGHIVELEVMDDHHGVREQSTRGVPTDYPVGLSSFGYQSRDTQSQVV